MLFYEAETGNATIFSVLKFSFVKYKLIKIYYAPNSYV